MVTAYAKWNYGHRSIEEIHVLSEIADRANFLLNEFIALPRNRVDQRDRLLRELHTALVEFAKIESFGLNATRQSH